MFNEIMQLVYQVRQKHPNLRFAQIISNAAQLGGWENTDVFYCDDEIIIKGLESLLNLSSESED